MELHQLRYFVAVADEGGFCKAADRCGIAQPSMSQQVRKLEDELECRLFDRLGRKIILTEEGRQLLPRARRVLAEVRELRQSMSGGVAEGAGRLAIGAIPTIAPFVLPSLVKRLRKSRPGCEIEIREDVTGNLVRALVDAELDVCLVGLPLEHEQIETERLGDEAMVVALPKDHRWAPRESVSLAMLDDEPMILLHEEHCFGQRLASLCAGASVKPRVTSTSAHLHTALALVASGQGVAVVPAMCATRSKNSACAFVPLSGKSAVRDVAVAWRKGRTLSTAAREFVQSTREGLREELNG